MSILDNKPNYAFSNRGDEASAKYVQLCYNEENIKNGEQRVNRKLQTRFCGGSGLRSHRCRLEKEGIKAVLVDLDNTLIAWNNPDGTPEMRQWLHDLRDGGIRVIVVSNNSPKRVKRAVEKFDIDYEAWSLKPFTFGIDRALKRFHYEKNEVVMVGDQLMTDIRAAHRAGIRSILVKPLVEHDSIKTQINRARERRVMKQMAEKYGPIVYKKGI